MRLTKLLVIEDSTDMCEAYQAVFHRHGYHAVFSLDMKEIRETMPMVDVVLSDYHMGLDFNVIKALAKQLNKPLLACTSVVECVHENQITKPFHIAKLLGAIDGLAGRPTK